LAGSHFSLNDPPSFADTPNVSPSESNLGFLPHSPQGRAWKSIEKSLLECHDSVAVRHLAFGNVAEVKVSNNFVTMITNRRESQVFSFNTSAAARTFVGAFHDLCDVTRASA
jgi:hypothetical protein